MIALDTNILVRFITLDDPEQSAQVERYLKTNREEFFVTIPVLLELVWLLSRRFVFSRAEIAKVLRSFSERADFVFEDDSLVMAALSAFERGGDFADHLIFERARAAGCSRLLTFDSEVLDRYGDFAIKPS